MFLNCFASEKLDYGYKISITELRTFTLFSLLCSPNIKCEYCLNATSPCFSYFKSSLGECCLFFCLQFSALQSLNGVHSSLASNRDFWYIHKKHNLALLFLTDRGIALSVKNSSVPSVKSFDIRSSSF